MKSVITDELAQAAFDWLLENEGKSAAARVMKERLKYKLKKVEAELFLEAEGNNKERESRALCHPEYDKALDEMLEASELDEFYSRKRADYQAVISAWQTCKSTERAFARVA